MVLTYHVGLFCFSSSAVKGQLRSFLVKKIPTRHTLNDANTSWFSTRNRVYPGMASFVVPLHLVCARLAKLVRSLTVNQEVWSRVKL